MKICIVTCGGDAPGMNSVLEHFVANSGYEIIAAKNGWKGLNNGEFIALSKENTRGISSRGGSMIKSSRERLSADNVREHLKREGVGALLVIGGNGTLAASERLGFNYLFIPGTIDNDIPSIESIGFDTALNNIIEAIDKIYDTAKSHSRMFAIETMGRESRDLAYKAALSTNSLFLDNNESEIEDKLKDMKYAAIIVPEYVDNIEGKLKKISSNIGKDIKLITLAHIQRGGAPSARDRLLGALYSSKAIELLKEGKFNRIVTL